MGQDPQQIRFRIIQLVFFLAALTLVGKAFHLQILDTSYSDRARTTAVHKYVKYPSRGLIFDRNGKLLVNNAALYDLLVTYNQMSADMDTAHFCKLLDISQEEFEERLKKDWGSVRYSKAVPFVFMSKIPSYVYAALQENLHEFPGFFVQVRNVRSYPYRSAANILGYISEVNSKQIDQFGGVYSLGDYLGASGLEQEYEEQLRGKKGVSYVLKDNLGRVVDLYKDGNLDSAAVSGQDLITTIDIDLQAFGERLMENKTGSIVAIEPSTGEVLAMVTAPNYDPNLLTLNRNRGEAFSQLIQDTLRPFFDRSVMAKYPPGSIFKTVVSLIAMQEKAIFPNHHFPCTMGYAYGGRVYGCHSHVPIHGVHMAIQHSCNAYYFRTFRKLIDQNGFSTPQVGMDLFTDYLYRFGLGRPLGLDFPSESAGNIPTSEYYDELYPAVKGGWRSPTVMSIAIGQGEMELSTIQMANLAAIMANKGSYTTPHLVKAFKTDKDSLVLPDRERLERYHMGIDSIYFDYVIDGMSRVVTSGTGYTAHIPDIEICGKTGTSQNPHGEDHSVFFAFAPRKDPKIAIAVYVENAGWGTIFAAPIASLMIEKYIRGEISQGRNYWYDRMLNADLVSNP